MRTRVKTLRAIKESPEDYDEAEARIKTKFREMLYSPLIKELKLGSERSVLHNSNEPLIDALQSGTLSYSGGRFHGEFSSKVSKALKELGAVWERNTRTYRLLESRLPSGVRYAISASETRFQTRLARIDAKLSKILPEEIAGSIKMSDLFDSTLFKVDRDLTSTLKGITVPPQLTASRRKKIADEWQNNMELYIKDFAEEEITKLRKEVMKSAFAGNRHEALVTTIQDSYGVTARKAKFLARQETSLLMTKFKESRYTDSGVTEYVWACVAGSPNHPVRPSHKILEGKTFSWDDPPITTAPDEPARRNNPGQDYNCRCFAKLIVRFKKETS
jgi:SPP1 gp7 family putative phage head morphogenesis protein